MLFYLNIFAQKKKYLSNHWLSAAKTKLETGNRMLSRKKKKVLHSFKILTAIRNTQPINEGGNLLDTPHPYLLQWCRGKQP